MEQFTGPNLNNLLAFLNRVQLSGEEAAAMVDLQQKIRQEMQRRTDLKQAGAVPLKPVTDPSDPDPSGMDRPPDTGKAATKKAATKKAAKKPH